MGQIQKILAATALTLIAAMAQADPWKGKGEAGAVWASGNTDTTSINLKLSMTKEIDLWKHALDMSYLHGTSNGETDANRFVGSWQSNYNFAARTFAFGALRYEHDEFSGFTYSQASRSGLQAFDTDTVKFSGQAGIGYRRIEDKLAATPSTA
jgi:putative salt-induced outer membrane protein